MAISKFKAVHLVMPQLLLSLVYSQQVTLLIAFIVKRSLQRVLAVGGIADDQRDALLRATGERWQVTRAEGDARPTLREEAEAAKSAAKAAMLRSPLVEATLAAFPGAELLDEQAEAQIHGRDGQNWRNRA